MSTENNSSSITGSGQNMGVQPVKCFVCDTIIKHGALIKEIMVGFRDDDEDDITSDSDQLRDVSKMFLVRAVCSVFSTESKPLVAEGCEDQAFCVRCAKVASEFYGHYNNLLNCSTDTAPINQFIEQFKDWHAMKSKKLPNGHDDADANSGGASTSKDENEPEDDNMECNSVEEILAAETVKAGVAEAIVPTEPNSDAVTEAQEEATASEPDDPKGTPTRKSARCKKTNQIVAAEVTSDYAASPARSSIRQLVKRLKTEEPEASTSPNTPDRSRRATIAKTPTPVVEPKATRSSSRKDTPPSPSTAQKETPVKRKR